MMFKVEFTFIDNSSITCIVPGDFTDIGVVSEKLAHSMLDGNRVIYWPIYNNENCYAVIPVKNIRSCIVNEVK